MNLGFIALVTGLVLVACARGAPDDAQGGEADSVVASMTPAEMPAFPTPAPGRVALATSHQEEHYVVNAAWDAWVGRCSGHDVLQIVAMTESYGFMLLLAPTTPDPSATTLPVIVANDSAAAPGSARVALQIYPEDRAYVLKGVDGVVELERVTDEISGRFSGRLVESTYRDTVFAAASFSDLPIEVVGDDYCLPMVGPPPGVQGGEGLEPKPVVPIEEDG